MEGQVESPHKIINPPRLAPPTGFAHVVVPVKGTTVFLGGQAGMDQSGKVVSPRLVEQFEVAMSNIVEALAAAGGRPEHVVSLQIFVTDATEYRSSLKEVGAAYRKHFGHHYPALALFEISGLLDPEARVEVCGVAVVP